MTLRQAIFARMYRRAPSIDALPWHRESPPALLDTRARMRKVGITIRKWITKSVVRSIMPPK